MTCIRITLQPASFLLFSISLVVVLSAGCSKGPLKASPISNSGTSANDTEIVEHIREHGLAVSDASDLDLLIEQAAERRLVLLGEASHGTSEYYTWRADISRRLIEEHDFDFIIVEGDWPLAFHVNRHVKHLEEEPSTSREVLEHFHRWPLWMWGNEEVLELVSWLHEHNRDLAETARAGFYGMDIYAYEQGIDDVIGYLEEVDAPAARTVRNYYSCFDRHPDMQSYLQNVHRTGEHCADDLEAVHRLLDEHRDTYISSDSLGYVNVLQSSRMIVHAERHIRGNLQDGPQSWNHRVDHFYDAASRLLEHYGEEAQGIVWAHNTHIGDARATTMRGSGMRNIGQIARERLGPDQVYAVGFGTYTGEVLAGRQWEGEMELMQVPEAQSGSYEDLMQRAGISPMLLMFRDPDSHQPLMEPRGNRAIGVVYHPEQEGRGNYVRTVLPLRYNAFLFFETTEALTPLE